MNTYIDTEGYEVLTKYNRSGKVIRAHILLAEKALGGPLPRGAVVHHHNEDKADNRPGNLVICPDRKYHNLLHLRMKSKKECGRPDWRKCTYCQRYDSPSNLSILEKQQAAAYHRKCKASYEQARTRGKA